MTDQKPVRPSAPTASSGELLFVLALLCVSTACYSYVPVEPTAPAPGANVRAHLNTAGSAAVTSQLGPGVTEVSGLLLDRDARSVSLLVDYYNSARQGMLSGGNEAIRLDVGQIEGIEQKQLSRFRSIILGAALVGGALLAGQIFSDEERVVEPPDPTDPGPPRLVVPISHRLDVGSRVLSGWMH